jgi:hypothetical protein
VADRKPLILDADGTFLKTDMLVESFWAGLGTAPIKTLGAVFRNFRAPARLKAALYDIAPIRADLLPVNSDIAAIAQGARDEGREVILARPRTRGWSRRWPRSMEWTAGWARQPITISKARPRPPP